MKSRMHSHAMRNITRIESAWWVRVLYLESPVSKVFSDSKLGGKERALVLAQSFRDSELKRLPTPSLGGVPVGPGRVFQEKKHWKDSLGDVHVYVAWSAWIRMTPGRPAQTSYSVRKHGAATAKKMAEDWLRRKTAERKLGE